jgi:hypothetical protein
MSATATRPAPRLSLGPISYYWAKDKVDDFYAMVADAPVPAGAICTAPPSSATLNT